MAAARSLDDAAPLPASLALAGETTHALYDSYRRQIFAFCLGQLGNREEAEDAVQSTFLRAYRALRRGAAPELELPWLYRIARNVCLNGRRSLGRRRRVETPHDLSLLSDHGATEQTPVDLIGLRRALAALPESLRRPLLLREWQGLSYAEIAEELGTSVSSVESAIFRARRKLVEELGGEQGTRGRKVKRGIELGSLLAGLRSLLGLGGAAAPVGSAVVAVAVGLVVAPPHPARTAEAAPAAAAAHAAPSVARPGAAMPVVASAARPRTVTITRVRAPGHARVLALAPPPARPAPYGSPVPPSRRRRPPRRRPLPRRPLRRHPRCRRRRSRRRSTRRPRSRRGPHPPRPPPRPPEARPAPPRRPPPRRRSPSRGRRPGRRLPRRLSLRPTRLRRARWSGEVDRRHGHLGRAVRDDGRDVGGRERDVRAAVGRRPDAVERRAARRAADVRSPGRRRVKVAGKVAGAAGAVTTPPAATAPAAPPPPAAPSLLK